MKVLAINSSPRTGGQSKTELMLSALALGIRDTGANVDSINLREKKIKNCIGCFTCWTKTPGICIQKDDMTNEIFPKCMEADLVVYATPLYYHTMNSMMSTLIERFLPMVHPWFETDNDGKTYHPLRNRAPESVWLSVCGFPEESEFNILSEYLNSLETKEAPIVAKIFRSDAESIGRRLYKEESDDILDATIKAGSELIDSKTISTETMRRITQPLQSLNDFTRLGNIFWKTCIKEGVTVEEYVEKEIVPRAESVDDFMLLFPYGLNLNAAGEGKVVLQFDFNGKMDESCYFDITKESIEAKKGSAKSPEIVITAPFNLWMDIMTQKADGEQMFLEEKYSVSGDLSLMLALLRKAA